MRRRRALQSLVAIPAASLLPAAAAAQSSAPPQAPPPRDDQYKVDLTNAEAAAEPVTRFFTPAQFAALRQLCGAILPAIGGRPGALECEAPEFLDFLIGASPAEVKTLYRDGLDQLGNSGVNEPALAPLRAPWTYHPPSDPYARFLVMAKEDILRASFNSRVWASSVASGRRRGGGSTNYYWLPLE